MAFKGITFAGQNVTPKNDKTLYQAHYGDGILYGCLMALGSDSLNISAGEFIEGGAVIQVDGGTSVDLSGRVNTDGYIQVIFNVDMTQGEGMQWYPTFVESATTTFPTLTQNPTWWNGYIYQLELAVIQVSGSNLTSIYRSLGYSTLVSNNDLILNGEDLAIEMFDENGVRQADIYSYDDNYIDISKKGTGGTTTSGIRMTKAGRVTMYGNGSEVIALRPNGVDDSSVQAYLSTSGDWRVTGDVRRTAQQYSGSRLTSLSISGTTNTKICETTVVETGVYLISVYCRVNMSGSGYAYTNIYKSSSASNTIVYDLHYLKSGNSYITTTTWATFDPNTPISFWVEPSGSCTVDSAHLYLIRIA